MSSGLSSRSEMTFPNDHEGLMDRMSPNSDTPNLATDTQSSPNTQYSQNGEKIPTEDEIELSQLHRVFGLRTQTSSSTHDSDDESDQGQADLHSLRSNNHTIRRSAAQTRLTPSKVYNRDTANAIASDTTSDSDMAQMNRPSRKTRSARPSYVDFPSEESGPSEEETVSDDYEEPSEAESEYSAVESELEEDFDASDNEVEAGALGDDEDGTETEDIAEPETSTTRKKRPSTRTKSSSAQDTGGIRLDRTLPPLHDFDKIIADMTERAWGLGLDQAVQELKKGTLRIATMCSGTEAPIVFLKAASDSLESSGRPPIRFQHVFSAEIEQFKQAFIERNFRPPLLFRDVREFIPEDATKAITAYGAEELIPGSVDILIAGFVCKDLSNLNNHKKGIDGDGETGDTWRAIHSYAKRYRPKVILLENVKAEKKLWDVTIKKQWDAIGYIHAWQYLDTKRYILPQTRQRMYMIAVDTKQFGKDAAKVLATWKDLLINLERPCSSPFESFIAEDQGEAQEYVVATTEPDWRMSKLRGDDIRFYENLGTRRPITNWNESGAIRPPDFANRSFFHSQPPRVWEACDIAGLQAAKEGSDALYKSVIWDVSQNVDRFKTTAGLMPCITPTGMPFISNQQRPLTGRQLLRLQGMPVETLVLGKETPKELQNLAGNQMSVTVIGASIFAAIAAASGVLAKQTHKKQQHVQLTPQATTTSSLDLPMDTAELSPSDTQAIKLPELIRDARLSSKLCSCEGTNAVSKVFILVCQDCGHTACSQCAGNPVHTFDRDASCDLRMQPHDFQLRWRPLLPARLRFASFPSTTQLEKQVDDPKGNADWRSLKELLGKAKISSQSFCMSRFERSDRSWKVFYTSPTADLELHIAKDVRWLIYLHCPELEPANSPLRKHTAQPLARGMPKSSLTGDKVAWEIRLPTNQAHQFVIDASEERTSGWRSCMGLPAYRDEKIPVELQLSCDSESSLTGTYSLINKCGTAKSSLYKRSCGSLYMFFDPDPIGAPKEDSFVFSEDCNRLQANETRVISGALDPSFNPWALQSGPSKAKVTVRGRWTPQRVVLQTAVPVLNASIPVLQSLSSLDGSRCSETATLLDVQLQEQLEVQSLSQYSWALERAKVLPSFSGWQEFQSHVPDHEEDCQCSPAFPQILWSTDDKRGGIVAREERQAASNFERMIKHRRPIFNICPSSSSTTANVRVGVNVASMAHRAIGRLGNDVDRCTWRLLTDHATVAAERFPKFKLMSNVFDLLEEQPRRLKYELHAAQRKSLHWMKAQEIGVPFTIAEVEEAVHTELGWRVEAKAEKTLNVRGGVLADLPSFGKTVTTIALIESEFQSTTPATLVRQNANMDKDNTSLINTAATLIICPPHLAKQWKEEFVSCLGKSASDSYKIILLEKYSDLCSRKVKDFKDTRVVIVSWALFADEDYIKQLACFSGLPPPALYKGRAFESWLDFVAKHIPEQVQLLQDDSDNFDDYTQQLSEERRVSEEFNQAIPLSVRHGSQYVSYNAMKGKSKKSAPKPRAGNQKSNLEPSAVPLLQMFNFNRLVVDEYHYLNSNEGPNNNLSSCAIVKRIPALKRWALSGTPALANFSDVNQIASFLNVRLGRNVCGDSTITTDFEKKLAIERTDVEKFLSITEVMTYQWHQARHQRAQEFLEVFVRQNEPELQDIECAEILRPVELALPHRLVYLETSQHLIAQRMQLKKLERKSSSDRPTRINASLMNCNTAEEALLKTALHFDAEDGAGLQQLIDKRRDERKETEREFMKDADKLRIKCLKNIDEPSKDYYLNLRVFVTKQLQDREAGAVVCRLLDSIDKKAAPMARTKKEPTKTVEKDVKEAASHVRLIAAELTSRIRSERFLKATNELRTMVDDTGVTHRCDALNCVGTSEPENMFVVSHCGHKACQTCLQARLNDEICVSVGCEVPLHAQSLINISDFGSTIGNTNINERHGRKLDEVSELLMTLPEDDQAILFAPNEQIVDLLQDVLDAEEISYSFLRRSRAQAAVDLETFKSNKDPETMSKVLILDLSSESAAGA